MLRSSSNSCDVRVPHGASARRSCPADSVAEVGPRWCGVTPHEPNGGVDANVRKSNHLQSRLSPATPTLQAAGELRVKKTGKGLIEATNSSRALASSGPPNITPRAFAAKAALVVGVATMTMRQRKL
jgi:hypothetical protein